LHQTQSQNKTDKNLKKITLIVLIPRLHFSLSQYLLRHPVESVSSENLSGGFLRNVHRFVRYNELVAILITKQHDLFINYMIGQAVG